MAKWKVLKSGDVEITEMLSEILIPAATARALVRALIGSWTPDERSRFLAEFLPPPSATPPLPAPAPGLPIPDAPGDATSARATTTTPGGGEP
jgi:hypothetical protein